MHCNNLKIIVLAIFLAGITGLKAQETHREEIITDTIPLIDTAKFLHNPIVLEENHPYVQQIDEAIASFHGEYTQYDKKIEEALVEDTTTFNDSILQFRLNELDKATPFHLVYNATTKNFIDLYVNRRRKLVATVLARKEYYFPMFEERLAHYNMPQEIKYLAIVESALRPDAKSWAKAAGLWQFMYNTGKIFGLQVTSYTDDRFDPYQSTDAACKYLKNLHKMFGNWELALAAYNSGPGNVKKAIRRSGGKQDFWEIYRFLPRETQGYVPAFIAVNYAMNYASQHGISPLQAEWNYHLVDTVHTTRRVDLKVLAKYLDTPIEDLAYLNRRYIHQIIPESKKGQKHYLYLPHDKIDTYLANEDSIVHYSLEFKKVYENTQNEPEDLVTYRVRKGDYLGKIAEKYGCGVSEIKKWNNLRSNNLRIGQRLTIYTKSSPKKKEVAKETQEKKTEETAATTKSNEEKPSTPRKEVEYLTYTIEKGDTLWDITRKFPGITVQDLTEHNEGINPSDLKVGQKIKIVKKG